MSQGWRETLQTSRGKFDSYTTCMKYQENIEDLVDKYWDKLFEELCHNDNVGDDLEEILIEVRVAGDGKTIRRSWADREKMLTERDA